MRDSLSALVIFFIGMMLGVFGTVTLCETVGHGAEPTVTVTTVHGETRHVEGVIVSDSITIVGEDVPAAAVEDLR